MNEIKNIELKRASNNRASWPIFINTQLKRCPRRLQFILGNGMVILLILILMLPNIPLRFRFFCTINKLRYRIFKARLGFQYFKFMTFGEKLKTLAKHVICGKPL